MHPTVINYSQQRWRPLAQTVPENYHPNFLEANIDGGVEFDFTRLVSPAVVNCVTSKSSPDLDGLENTSHLSTRSSLTPKPECPTSKGSRRGLGFAQHRIH